MYFLFFHKDKTLHILASCLPDLASSNKQISWNPSFQSMRQWNARLVHNKVQNHPSPTKTREKREMNTSLSGCSLLWRSGFSQTIQAKLYLVRLQRVYKMSTVLSGSAANVLTGLSDVRDLCFVKDQRCYSTFHLIVCAWQGRGDQMCVDVVLLVFCWSKASSLVLPRWDIMLFITGKHFKKISKVTWS